jgi:hypothetical protein
MSVKVVAGASLRYFVACFEPFIPLQNAPVSGTVSRQKRDIETRFHEFANTSRWFLLSSESRRFYHTISAMRKQKRFSR